MSHTKIGNMLSARTLRRPAALLALGLVFLLARSDGHAQSGDALNFFKNYFVTGDYVVGGVGLRGSGVNGIATKPLTISGVPNDAEVVAAFLYWQVVSSSSLGPDSGAVNATFDGSLLSSAYGPLSKALIKDGTAPCWSTGGSTGNGGGNKLTYTYRADVRRFLAVDATTGKLVVNGQHIVQVPDSGSNGNSLPIALGASLVVVYRDPRMPLRAVVLYDGGYTMNNNTDSMSRTIQGFYQSATAPTSPAKLTHVVGSAQLNKSERLLLPGLDPVLNPFIGALGNNWDSPTYNVSIPPGSSTAVTSVDHLGMGSFDCLSWGAIIFSTEVQDTDGDGLLDIWESSASPLLDPNGQPLPNLRAMAGADNSNVKDVFVQIDYMANGPGTYNHVSKPAHSHLPEAAALKMVGDAFASKGIKIHFDVGSNYQSNEGGAGPYIIPASTGVARGGKAIDENQTLLGCPGPTCEFPDSPGTVGWKVGFKFYRDQLLSATPPDLDAAGNDPCDAPGNDGPGQPCERRFDRNRQDTFRYVLGAHALGLAKSEFPCLDATGNPTGAGASGVCDVANNDDFHIPRTTSGVGDFPGGDLMLTLGGFSDIAGRPVGTTFMQASTLMHELGHTFDLGHSGAYIPGVPAEPNCKPNYLSSMNYLFQLRGLFNDSLPLGTPHLDFSNEVLGGINEAPPTYGPLNGAPSYHTGWYAPVSSFTTGTAATKHCDGTPVLAGEPAMVRVDGPSAISLTSDWTSRSIDWNPNPAADRLAPQDVNFDGFTANSADSGAAGVHALHDGSNDWTSLRLNQLATRRNVLGLSLDLGRDGLGRGDKLGRDGLGRDGLGRDGLGRDGLGRDGLGRDGLGRDGLGRDGLGRDGLGRDGLGIAGLGRDGLGLEEVDTVIASASGHAPPNSFNACQIGTAGCIAAAPSTPTYHRVFASWNATDVDPDLVVEYRVYRFKTADGLPTATLAGSVPGPASATPPPVTGTYSLVDTQELPNGLFTYYAVAMFTGAAAGPSSPSNPLISINVINDAPVPNQVAPLNDSYSMNQGGTLTVAVPGVLGNDRDDDSAALTTALVTPPSNGSLAFGADGSFTYTPIASFAGVDTFVYAVDDVDPGNARSATVSIEVRDLTPPLIQLTIPPPTGSNGYFKTSPVLVGVVVTDPSLVASVTCNDGTLSLGGLGTATATGTLSLSAQGTHNLVCTAIDGKGNNGAAPGSTNTGTVKIDSIAPTVTITAVANNATPILKATVASSFSCSDGAVPPASGVASCVGTVANGANINTATVGPKTFAVTATDVAGNTTTVTNNYTVVYNAILSPLKTSATQGSVVPVVWALKDALGNSINSLSTLVKMESVFNGPASGACVASAVGTKDLLFSPATGAAGGSDFRLVSGGYQFNWDTTTTTTLPVVTAKGCYTVLIYLDDQGAAKMTTAVQLK